MDVYKYSYKIARNFENMLLNILKFDPIHILCYLCNLSIITLKRVKNTFGPYLQSQMVSSIR